MGFSPARVLLGSPIRQKPEILREFLTSCQELQIDNLSLDYLFIDNNTEDESGQLLRRFAERHANVKLDRARGEEVYICDERTHNWDEGLIWKVAALKNMIITRAREGNYDYLFLVDSDVVLNPQTLVYLAGLDKDIVSEIFWTRWEPDFPELPQVWISDQYNLYESSRGENLTLEEMARRIQVFLKKLQEPGVYRVGGLGACTLLSRKAVRSGLNFDPIYNVSFIGEDRHFCIRAAVLGFDLFVDTHFPAYHIYRLSDLEGIKDFKLRIKEN